MFKEAMETQERGKLGNRILASLIDCAVVGCFFLFFAHKYGESNAVGEYTVHGIKALIPIGFWLLYVVVIEGLFNATIGHFILGLKVVKTDGERIDFITSLKRHLADPIDFFFFGVVGIILIKNTALNQRFGDIWAKTIVITDKEER